VVGEMLKKRAVFIVILFFRSSNYCRGTESSHRMSVLGLEVIL